MTTSDEKISSPDVRIRIGHVYEVMHEERRVGSTQFADELRTQGLTVELEITEYVPGRRGLTPVEWMFIGIATAKALDLVTDEAKASLRRRRKAKKAEGSAGRTLGLIIYGPNGEKVLEWTTREDEEEAK